MKYYSDKLNRLYETAEDCQKAEFEATKAEEEKKALAERKAAEAKAQKEKDAAERKAMAAEVEEARKAMVAAQKAYRDKIDAFVKKYHSYHFSTTNADEVPTLFDLFDQFFF